jgi:hypothetical protein
VVGHGHGRHAQFFYSMTEFLDVTSTVEHGIVSMKMKVNKLRHSVNSILMARASTRKPEICCR